MKTLLFVTTCGFEAGHENRGQFRSFLGKFAQLFVGQIFSFGRESEPELGFIRFLQCDLKFGTKFGFGPRHLRCSVISRCACAASCQLMRDGPGARTTGQGIRSLEAAKCEAPSAPNHVDHSSFYPFSSFDQTSIQLQ